MVKLPFASVMAFLAPMLMPAPATGRLFRATNVPVTVMGAGTLMVMVALAVRLAPAVAVSVAVVVDVTLIGGV